jgi:hypothetical protein
MNMSYVSDSCFWKIVWLPKTITPSTIKSIPI